jgi:hypothetical protein
MGLTDIPEMKLAVICCVVAPPLTTLARSYEGGRADWYVGDGDEGRGVTVTVAALGDMLKWQKQTAARLRGSKWETTTCEHYTLRGLDGSRKNTVIRRRKDS